MERAACFAVLDRADRQVLAAEHAIASRPDAGDAGAPLAVDHDAAALELDPGALQDVRRPALADGGEQHVGLDAKDGAGRGERARVLVRVLEQHAAELASVPLDRHRPGPGADHDAVRLREFALEPARLHVILAAPIDDRDVLRAELLRLHGDVDRRHAAADDDDPPPDRQRGLVLRLTQGRDIVDRVGDVFELALARQAELVGRPEPHGEKHGVVVASELVELDVLAEGDAVLRLDAADRQDEGGLLGGEVVDRLVGGDAVFVEAARLAARLEDRDVDAGDGERVRAGEARGPGADDRHALSGRRGARIGRSSGVDHGVGGVALQRARSGPACPRRLRARKPLRRASRWGRRGRTCRP